jgi:lysophospholipase L1-like esterase
MSFLLEPGQTVVFAGDSITDAGRTLGLGVVGERTLGEGYVRDVAGLIDARYPGLGLALHNAGVGGITSQVLADLWDDQVLAHDPAWVTIMIGINDCNLTLMSHEVAVPPDRYATNLRDIVARTTAAGARVAPGEQEQRTLALLAQYHRAVHDLSNEYGTLHVDTHRAFQEQLAHRTLAELGIEPVHPTPSGHLVIAHALLNAWKW